MLFCCLSLCLPAVQGGVLLVILGHIQLPKVHATAYSAYIGGLVPNVTKIDPLYSCESTWTVHLRESAISSHSLPPVGRKRVWKLACMVVVYGSGVW